MKNKKNEIICGRTPMNGDTERALRKIIQSQLNRSARIIQTKNGRKANAVKTAVTTHHRLRFCIRQSQASTSHSWSTHSKPGIVWLNVSWRGISPVFTICSPTRRCQPMSGSRFFTAIYQNPETISAVKIIFAITGNVALCITSFSFLLRFVKMSILGNYIPKGRKYLILSKK